MNANHFKHFQNKTNFLGFDESHDSKIVGGCKSKFTGVLGF